MVRRSERKGNVIKGWEGLKTKTTKGSTNKRPKRDEMLFTDSSIGAMEMPEISEILSSNLSFNYPNYREIQRKGRLASNKKKSRKLGGSEYGDSDDDYLR